MITRGDTVFCIRTRMLLEKPAAQATIANVGNVSSPALNPIAAPGGSQGPLTLSEIRARARAKMEQIENRFKELDDPK